MKAVHGSKSKCDHKDAEAIARLIKGGNFPLAYAYPKERRGLRDLLRARQRLVRQRDTACRHTRIDSCQRSNRQAPGHWLATTPRPTRPPGAAATPVCRHRRRGATGSESTPVAGRRTARCRPVPRWPRCPLPARRGRPASRPRSPATTHGQGLDASSRLLSPNDHQRPRLGRSATLYRLRQANVLQRDEVNGILDTRPDIVGRQVRIVVSTDLGCGKPPRGRVPVRFCTVMRVPATHGLPK